MVLGMHFFSPAHLMRLVEVVKGRHTSRAALEAVLRVTKAMGKVGVVVGNCDGFVGSVCDEDASRRIFLPPKQPGILLLVLFSLIALSLALPQFCLVLYKSPATPMRARAHQFCLLLDSKPTQYIQDDQP